MTDSTQPQLLTPVVVAIDQYVVAREDRLLCARLAGSFAVCISDEVFESGALLHMQAGRPGKATNTELTDNTLSMDLLLLDHCLTELRAVEPQARHWQARFFAHCDPAVGGEERVLGLRAFFEAALEDSGISMSDGHVYVGPTQWLSFRPAMRQMRCVADVG